MALGRQDGIIDFMDWIEGKTEIPGPEGKMIKVDKIVYEDDYMRFVEAYEEGEPIESDLYSIPKRRISPGAEKLTPF